MKATALAFGATGSLIVLGTAAVSLGDRGLKSTSYATSSPGLAVLASVTGAALFGAATLLAAEGGRTVTVLATFALGLAWSADVWAGWSRAPAVLRDAAILLVPLTTPFVLLAVASTVGRRRFDFSTAAAASLGIAGGFVLWLVRDPYVDRYCWRDCLAHPFAPFADASLARTATHVTLVFGAACGGIAVVLSVIGFLRRMTPWPLLAGVVCGATLALSDVSLRLQPAEDPKRLLFASLFVANGIALAALGASLGWLALRPRFMRRGISRLVTDPDRAAGGLTAALATALGDSELRVGYPLPDGRIVASDGTPAALSDGATQIIRGGELIALVGSAAGGPQPARLERALGPAAKLALANERLQAEQLVRLRELTALRRRLVATGDAERRRIERDLHDGAQQRLLALAIDLQVALKHAQAARSDEAGGLISAAADCVTRATGELRRVAHGIFPSTLANVGLVAALESLADERRLVLSIGLEPGRRFPADIESAAYTLAEEASSGAAGPIGLALKEDRSGLVIIIEGATTDGGGAEDRIGAAGGTLTRTQGRLEALLPVSPA